MVPLIAMTLTVLGLDVAALVVTRTSAPPAPVAVMGHVVERAPSAPRIAARRAPVPTHAPVGAGREAPETFIAGGQAPPPPPSRTLDAPTWLDERGAAALARIDYPWQRLGFEIDFAPARSGLRAITYTRERRIVVFTRRGDSVAQTAFDLAHELGHAFDVVHGNWPRRQRWLELRGVPADTPWFGCSGCDDLATGAGDLAEVFALWQVGPVDFASRVAPAPSAAQLADLVELFDPSWTSRSDPTQGESRSGSPDSDTDSEQPPASEEDREGTGSEDPGDGEPDQSSEDDREDTGSEEPDGGDPDQSSEDPDEGEEDPDEDRPGGGPVPCPILCS